MSTHFLLKHRTLSAVAIWISLLCVSANCVEVAVSAENRAALPGYDFPYENPYYASIAGYLSVKKVRIERHEKLTLHVPGFSENLPVRTVRQGHVAPLVVMLAGITGRSEDDFVKLWQKWYADAGFHVLSMDSSFLPTFNNRSGHGVSGNLWIETEKVRDVIAAYLKQSGIEDRVSSIGIVGMSYGATQALMLGKLAKEGKVPFKIDAIQAYSPPINMQHSADILERWDREDRPRYTLAQLQPVAYHKPSPEYEHEFSDCMLRAAFATAFRLPLAYVIVENDQLYCLDLLPRGDEFNDLYWRYDHAATWGFRDFAYGLSYPYWQQKLGLNDLQPLIDSADIERLLEHAQVCTEVILAVDDPLNEPDDLNRLRRSKYTAAATYLPRGGHLGYVSNEWTRTKLLSLFTCADQKAQPVKFEEQKAPAR